MKWYGTLLALALLSAMLLAGCGGSDDLDASSGGGPGSGDTRDGHMQAPAHAFREQPLSVHIVEEGTTAGPDRCILADHLCDTTNPGFRQVFDITDHLEPGVPTNLALSFEYDTGTILSNSYSVTLQTEDTTVFSVNEQSDWGHVQIEAYLVPSASSSVKVEAKAYGFDYTADTHWTFTLDLNGASETIEPVIPVLIPGHADNHGLNITTAGSGNAEFVLWAGDEVVAINETTSGHFHYEIPAKDRRIDHILLLRPDSAPVTVNATGPEPVQKELRGLTSHWEPVGSAHTLTPGDKEEWDFQLDSTPLAVGIGIRSSKDSLTGMVTGTVTGPGGDLLEIEEGCEGCWGIVIGNVLIDTQWEHRQRTSLGAEGLGPGTYTVEMEYAVFMAEVWGHDAQIEVQAYEIVFSQ